MKFDSYDNFRENDDFVIYYSGELDDQKSSTYQFCQMFVSLWNDYQIENDSKTKDMFLDSFFSRKSTEKYVFYNDNNVLTILSNNVTYFPEKINKISNEIHIFFDYKEQKNPIIKNIFDVMEATVCIQDNNSNYIDFSSDNMEKLSFLFNSIGLCVINKLETPLIITIHIIPLIEEFTFSIPSHTKQFGTMYENYCVVSQIKI